MAWNHGAVRVVMPMMFFRPVQLSDSTRIPIDFWLLLFYKPPYAQNYIHPLADKSTINKLLLFRFFIGQIDFIGVRAMISTLKAVDLIFNCI